MTYKQLKEACEKSERFKTLTKEQKERYNEEIKLARRFYENKRNLFLELKQKKDKIDNRYVIPYLLNFTEKIETNKTPEYIQVSSGSSGGIDVDMDISSYGREKVFEYLQSKYGKENVLYVGTSSVLGPSSAAKDLLRTYGIDFKESNAFTSCLEKAETWEENIQRIKNENPAQYSFYKKHKEILDLTPKFINKVRQNSKHAGGMIILPKPVYNYIPVNRVSGEITSALPESGQVQSLDEIGIVKFDILSISILDVMKSAIDMIDEELYLIEDDDGIQKIVSESFIHKK